MEKLEGTIQSNNLKMATEDYYREQAKFYRSSEEYGRMTRLYPLLKTSINECQEERLIN